MAWTKQEICQITAELELQDGYYVNLGIGMPMEIANYVPKGINITLHTENGMLGMGPYPRPDQVDPDLINAGKQTVTELPQSSYFDSALSFAMIRKGRIDLTILGALQVSQQGDLANWTIPGKLMKGMGGAMDLVAGAKRVVVLMDHIAKDGSPKILKQCHFPLTGVRVVHRIITDLGIMDIKNDSLELTHLAPGVTIEEISKKTEADFTIGKSLKEAA
jgi:3-oxoacid CoA-transferase subunit B